MTATLAEILILKVQMSPLFCADSVILRQTVQFVHPTVNYVIAVQLNLRVVQFFVNTAQIL